MKEHIQELAQELAQEYTNSLDLISDGEVTTTEEFIEYAQEDFTAGINRVLQHPEYFGLQAKEYE